MTLAASPGDGPGHGRWLLLRRAGALWGVPSAAVRSLRRDAGDVATVELQDRSSLQADELLELTAALRPYPLPRCVGAGAFDGIAALASWGGVPVALVAPGEPLPAALLAPDPASRPAAAADGHTLDPDGEP